jgi:ArsR family metal-binding transcriptional regulator
MGREQCLEILRIFDTNLAFAPTRARSLAQFFPQKAKVLPILAEEAPKVEAIKNNNSLSSVQKMQQIRAIHQQTDPQMKTILSPAQYQKLQAIRQQAVREAMEKRRGR